MKYNLIDSRPELGAGPADAQFGFSIIPYAPLHGGLLADLGLLEREITGDQRFAGPGFSESEVATARGVDRFSFYLGLAPYQTCLTRLLAQPVVALSIVGAEKRPGTPRRRNSRGH